MMNKLDQLKAMTDVVADTGDIDAIAKYRPLDATTNPSLLLKAAAMPGYQHLVDAAKSWAASQPGTEHEQLAHCTDKLAVLIGLEILKIIPGRVSTEADARLSFDTRATIAKARRLISLYDAAGVSPDRVLIKIASTWEGIEAARQLEQEGINCNLTLLFSFTQAAACADAGTFLISPFVGRILDWFKRDSSRDSYPAIEDPGVLSVAHIYNFFKQHGYTTVVMGASFRNVEEIEALAGCDRLTISPQFLAELEASESHLPRRLSPDDTGSAIEVPEAGEMGFRWGMNEDAMATEKLAEGIRNFAADQIKLEKLIGR